MLKAIIKWIKINVFHFSSKLEETIDLEKRLKYSKKEFQDQFDKYKKDSESIFTNYDEASEKLKDAKKNRDMYKDKAKALLKDDEEKSKKFFKKFKDWEGQVKECEEQFKTAEKFKNDAERNLRIMNQKKQSLDSRTEQLKFIIANLKANKTLEQLISPSDNATLKAIEEEIAGYEHSVKAKQHVQEILREDEVDEVETKDASIDDEFAKFREEA